MFEFFGSNSGYNNFNKLNQEQMWTVTTPLYVVPADQLKSKDILFVELNEVMLSILNHKNDKRTVYTMKNSGFAKQVIDVLNNSGYKVQRDKNQLKIRW